MLLPDLLRVPEVFFNLVHLPLNQSFSLAIWEGSWPRKLWCRAFKGIRNLPFLFCFLSGLVLLHSLSLLIVGFAHHVPEHLNDVCKKLRGQRIAFLVQPPIHYAMQHERLNDFIPSFNGERHGNLLVPVLFRAIIFRWKPLPQKPAGRLPVILENLSAFIKFRSCLAPNDVEVGSSVAVCAASLSDKGLKPL